jgi:hypothetical protein
MFLSEKIVFLLLAKICFSCYSFSVTQLSPLPEKNIFQVFVSTSVGWLARSHFHFMQQIQVLIATQLAMKKT